MIRAALVAAAMAVAGCGTMSQPAPSVCPASSECLEWDCKFDKSDTPRDCVCVHERR